MKVKRWANFVVLGTVLLVPAITRGESAPEAFSKGETLLAKGDFPAALASFASAARADRSNPEYMQHYAIVRRIVDLRTRLDSEKNPQQWEYMAKGLRAFYASELIYPELLKLDQEIHGRLNTAESAAMLAETQLALDENASAAKTLSALDRSKATEMTQALLGIALVRSERTDEAKRIAENFRLPGNLGPSITYAAARLHAATGDTATAVDLLKTCFEGTLPSQLEGFKAHARACPEFAALAPSPEFARVLETKSKMPESKCSGGSSCAGCPMSGKCPKSQAKQ